MRRAFLLALDNQSENKHRLG